MLLVVLTATVCALAQVTPGRQAQVEGRIQAHDGKPLLSAAVIISTDAGDDAHQRAVGQARIEPDGRFTFSNVAAGRYVLRARGQTEPHGASLFATFRVTVTDGRDVTGVELTLTPGATLDGRVEISRRHGAPPPPVATLRVRAPLADGAAFGDTLTGSVGEDGRFRLAGLMAGAHVLVIEGLAFPWRLSEAWLRGRDVANVEVDLERDERFSGVRLVLSDTAAGVTGAVSVPDGVSPSNLLVVAFPADEAKRRVPLRFVRVGRVGPDGRYRVVDLAPDAYLVAAADVSERDAMSPAVLERLARGALNVRLAEAQVSRLRLPGIAPAAQTIR